MPETVDADPKWTHRNLMSRRSLLQRVAAESALCDSARTKWPPRLSFRLLPGRDRCCFSGNCITSGWRPRHSSSRALTTLRHHVERPTTRQGNTWGLLWSRS